MRCCNSPGPSPAVHLPGVASCTGSRHIGTLGRLRTRAFRAFGNSDSHGVARRFQLQAEQKQHWHQGPSEPMKRDSSALQHAGRAAAVMSSLVAPLLLSPAALAFQVHTEPSNALSVPTWAIHISSVIEWVTAMGLMWRYAEVSGNPRWKGMAWGMVPSLGSALAACTWHFFYNSTDLDFLVTLQAFLTVLGNATCWWAAYRIFTAAQQPSAQ